MVKVCIDKAVNRWVLLATGLFEDKRCSLGELQALFLYNAVQYSYKKHYVLARYIGIEDREHGGINDYNI